MKRKPPARPPLSIAGVIAIAAMLGAASCSADQAPPPDDAVGPVPNLTENAMKVPGFADLMGVSFTGFCIPEKSINNIEQDRFGIAVQGFNIFQSFNSFFIIRSVFPFS